MNLTEKGFEQIDMKGTVKVLYIRTCLYVGFWICLTINEPQSFVSVQKCTLDLLEKIPLNVYFSIYLFCLICVFV